MLVQFLVENFMSFRNEAVLSMLAAKRKSKDKSLDARSTFETDFDFKLLKTAVIYGANASGKSNLFKAMRFMKDMVIDSSKESQADESIDVSPFLLNMKSATRPSRFAVIFIHEKNLYEYAFSANTERVITESLKVKTPNDAREKILFERLEDDISVSPDFVEGFGLEVRTRDNALFLSVCANFDGKVSASVISWFRKVRVISGLADMGLMNYTIKRLKDEESNKKILSLLEAFDTGFTGIKVADSSEEKTPEAFKALQAAIKKTMPGAIKFSFDGRILTEHQVFNDEGKVVGVVDFELSQSESEGTKKLVALAGPLLDVLDNSYIMFLDELDARLHPALSLEIFKMFNCNTKNRNCAQLIAATHSTNLLDKDTLRRDQVWFTSKTMPGESKLISLVEYRVRNDASFEKDYLSGKYGGIPLLGEIDSLF